MVPSRGGLVWPGACDMILCYLCHYDGRKASRITRMAPGNRPMQVQSRRRSPALRISSRAGIENQPEGAVPASKIRCPDPASLACLGTAILSTIDPSILDFAGLAWAG